LTLKKVYFSKVPYTKADLTKIHREFMAKKGCYAPDRYKSLTFKRFVWVTQIIETSFSYSDFLNRPDKGDISITVGENPWNR